MNNAVGIDVEGHFNLRYATWCWWQVNKLEFTECLVVLRHFALTLQHVNFYRWLHVFCSGEHFSTTCRNGGIALDELCHDAALGFNSQRQRCDVEEQHIFYITLQYACLHCCTNSNYFVGVYRLVWLFAGQ